MDRDPDDLGKRVERWRTLEQVLIPVRNLPVARRGPGNASQGERWRENVFAEAGVRIFRVERIDQERGTRPWWVGPCLGVESGRDAQRAGSPRRPHGAS